MMASDDTSSTASSSAGGGGSNDNQQRQQQHHNFLANWSTPGSQKRNHGRAGSIGSPLSTPRRPRGLVRTAARRMHLAWQNARTNAEAQRTMQAYDGGVLSNSSQHSQASLKPGGITPPRLSSPTPFTRQSPSFHDLPGGRNHAKSNSRSNTPTLLRRSSSSAVCQTIDDAMFCLYSYENDQPDGGDDDKSHTTKPQSPSFQLPNQYDAILDAEHPFASLQDIQDSTDYWMEQWSQSVAVEERRESDTAASKAQTEPLPFDEGLQQMLTHPQNRPLLPLILMDEQRKEVDMVPPTTRIKDDEKKDSDGEVNDFAGGQAQQEDEDDDDDDDDFGDFQSAAQTVSKLKVSPDADNSIADTEMWHTTRDDAFSPPPLHPIGTTAKRQPATSDTTENTEQLIWQADEILKQNAIGNATSPPSPGQDGHSLELTTPQLINLTQAVLEEESEESDPQFLQIPKFPPVSPPREPTIIATGSAIPTTPRRPEPSPKRPSTGLRTPTASPPPTRQGYHESSDNPIGTSPPFSSSPSSAFARTPTRGQLGGDAEGSRVPANVFLNSGDGVENDQEIAENEFSKPSSTTDPEGEMESDKPSSSPDGEHVASDEVHTTEAPPRISLTLPIDDLTSAEGRWIRRQQLEQKRLLAGRSDIKYVDDEDNVTFLDEKDLPERDETLQVLNSLPWEYLAGFGDDENQPFDGESNHGDTSFTHLQSEVDLWDQVMTDRLCAYDTKLEAVQREMTRRVDREQVAHVNELMHVWDTNLRVANVYYERAMNSLSAAVHQPFLGDTTESNELEVWPNPKDEGAGLLGQMLLLELWQSRDDIKALEVLLDQLHSMFEIEQEIIERIDNFDAEHSNALDEYRHVRELADQVNELATRPSLAGISCVKETRERLGTLGDRFWNRLHHVLGNCIMRACRTSPEYQETKKDGSSWIAYERIFTAAMDLEHVEVQEDSVFATSWCETILKALSFESNRCFAVALLDPPGKNASRYDLDLVQLSMNLLAESGDTGKLKQTCHNLVTVRFDFEADQFYFPRVFQALVDGLGHILETTKKFLQFHQQRFSTDKVKTSDDESDTTRLATLSEVLNAHMERVWEQCEQVLIHCLDEYIRFSGKRELFACKEGVEVDDSLWIQDLAGLECVLDCTENFLNQRGWFLKGRIEEKVPIISLVESMGESVIFQRLSTICHAHLRAIHVEAMTTTGRSLSKDSWVLSELDAERKGDCGADFIQGAFESHFETYERRLADSRKDSGLRSPRSSPLSSPSLNRPTTSKLDNFLECLISGKPDEVVRVAPPTLANGVLGWISRLSLMAEKLPLVATDISGVIKNIFDLYLATVLRMCTGNIKNEKLLVGAERASPLMATFDDGRRSPLVVNRPSSPAIFGGFGKDRWRQKNPRPQITFPPLREVDICAPLLKDEDEFAVLRAFTERARDSLHGIVNLDRVDTWLTDPEVDADMDTDEIICAFARAFEKRVSAAWSCVTLACIGDTAFHLTLGRLEQKHGAGMKTSLEALESYTKAVAQAVPTMVEVLMLYSSVKAIGGRDFVSRIMTVGSVWEENNLHEHPNDYVDYLCERCSLVWGFVAASGKLPQGVMNQCWGKIELAGYLCLLEGFARVPFCSTEGRALMALDLASYSAGISTAALNERLENHNLPFEAPPRSHANGMRMVDTYVKVFYYPKDEVPKWIMGNFRDYKMPQSMALITAANASDSVTEAQLQKQLNEVKELYRQAGTQDAE